jgi:hypothetical protein
MGSAGVVRALLAVMAAAMVFAAGAQALTVGGGTTTLGGTDTTGASGALGASGEVPSQAEVDGAIAALKNGTAGIRELKAPQPDWFTPELQQRVHENGTAAAPVDAPLPGQAGIRPGSMMISPFICTMNYVFQKGDTVAIGTAGHCIDGNEPVVLLTVAPTGGNPVLVELGRVLLKQNAGIGRDYALVEVPPERRDWVFPTIAAIGGPCGIYSGGDPQPVAHYGQGLVGGFPGTPRRARAWASSSLPIRSSSSTTSSASRASTGTGTPTASSGPVTSTAATPAARCGSASSPRYRT